MTIGARTRIQLALLRADLQRWNEGRDEPMPRWKQRLIPMALIAFLLIAFGIVGRIDLEAERAALGDDSPSLVTRHSSPAAERLTLDLRDCTPPGVPVNNQVDLTIHHHGDRTVIGGCTRYAANNTITTSRIVNSEW